MINKINIQNKIIEINNYIKTLDNDCNIDLVNGISGLILFQYQFYTKYNIDDESLIISLEKLYTLIPNSKIGLNYSSGLSGVFDVLNYLNEVNFIDDGYQDSEYMLNQIFKEQLLHYVDKLNLDFLHGSSGVLLYLVNSSNPEISVEYYALVVDLYKKRLMKYENNLIAFPSYNFKKFSPEYEINLSLSHGNSAIICILSKIFSKTKNNKVKNIIEDLFKSYEIVKRKNNNRILSLYPHSTSDLNESRIAWCYGDLGIANAYWQAGKAFNNLEWKQEAIAIMLHSAKRRDLKENKVVDAGICHGTAGIAHIFNRFYKETHIKEFDEARLYWLNETLHMAKFDDGLLGYKSFHGEQGWLNDYGLLEGIAGIGLVLLGFLTDDVEDLNWDRCLLLS